MQFFSSGLWLDDSVKARERKFGNVDEMNRCIIAKWNRWVTDNDTVYILGDVGEFGYLKELKGKKILLLAQSDYKLYTTYINSVSNERDEVYDKEMFKVYAINEYKVSDVLYRNYVVTKLYSGRVVGLSADFRYCYGGHFNIVNLPDYIRVGKGIFNSSISMNHMAPVSEVEVESLISRYISF